MCAYFSKSEDEVSEAMKQAAKEAFNSNKTNIEQMRSIARAYATKRECSVQEAKKCVSFNARTVASKNFSWSCFR